MTNSSGEEFVSVGILCMKPLPVDWSGAISVQVQRVQRNNRSGQPFSASGAATLLGENVVRLAPASERRHAAVLFADIVNCTVMVRDLEGGVALERLSPVTVETMKR